MVIWLYATRLYLISSNWNLVIFFLLSILIFLLMVIPTSCMCSVTIIMSQNSFFVCRVVNVWNTLPAKCIYVYGNVPFFQYQTIFDTSCTQKITSQHWVVVIWDSGEVLWVSSVVKTDAKCLLKLYSFLWKMK